LLIPLTDSFDVERALRYSLTLTVESEENVMAIIKACSRCGIDASVHIKVNTGMNRFGVDPNRVAEFCKLIKSYKNIKVSGCFTHFYNTLDHYACDRQFNVFLNAKQEVETHFKNIIHHASASGGVLLSRRYDLDMVRCGLLIYGYKPIDGDIDVKPVLEVEAPVVKTAYLRKGDNLLYGDYKIDEDKAVSIVRTGYADGLRRNSGLLNNRCMDVSAYRAKDLRCVTVFNDAEAVAKKENTITYEVLCAVTKRANIVYKD